jgi:hypothetical protein
MQELPHLPASGAEPIGIASWRPVAGFDQAIAAFSEPDLKRQFVSFSTAGLKSSSGSIEYRDIQIQKIPR